MKFVASLRSWIISVLRRSRVERDMDEELRFHIEQYAGDLVRAGMSAADARRRAHVEFGAIEARKDECREAIGLRLADEVTGDVRYAFRQLRRAPAFAAIAVLTMALGIGATTTLFSVTYGVLLNPLPWPEADRLVRLTESRAGHDPRVRGTISNGPYIAWHARGSTIEAIGGWLNGAVTGSIAGGEAARFRIASVTPTLFTVLKARPLVGRLFADDDVPPNSGVASRRLIILSFGLWQERFGGGPDAIGRILQIDGKPTTVVGVMPREFAFPDRETRAWLPFTVPSVRGDVGVTRITIFQALARLRPGVTPEQASAEGTARARAAPDPGLAARAMFGSDGPAEIRAVPAIDQMTADVMPALMVLLAAVILLLVTATANVASLQLARATTRHREIAIRAAIGAGASRLTRQLVVESSILGVLGGAGGLGLAAALDRALPSVLPADFPRVEAIRMDVRVLLFAVGVSMVVSVGCGLLPAVQARRVHLVESLSDDGSAPVGGGLRSRTARTRAFIMTGQLAISCMLLVGAALLTRSFVALLRADRGYDPTNVLTAQIPLPDGFPIERRTAMLEALAGRLRAVPGVRDVAYGNALPLLTVGGYAAFKMRPPSNPDTEVQVDAIERGVSPGYFAALGLHLAAGRTFNDADTATSPMVVIVNRSFAARYLGATPIGAVIPHLGMCRGDDDRWEVVGVVGDVHQGSVADPVQPELFLPFRQIGCPAAVAQPILVVRTAADPLPLVGVLRGVFHQQEPALALDSVMTMEDRVMTTLAKPRLYAVVLVGFGAFALVIAGVGLFGMLSYNVAQRAREIGVRTALGAQPLDIAALVFRQVAVIGVVGIGVGLAMSFIVTSALASVLYGVAPHDAASFAAAPLILAAIAGLSCVAPIRRAARMDPLKALR
jgi:predicted permease